MREKKFSIKTTNKQETKQKKKKTQLALTFSKTSGMERAQNPVLRRPFHPPPPLKLLLTQSCVAFMALMMSTPFSALRSSRSISSSTILKSAICSGDKRVASFAVSPPDDLFTTPMYSSLSCARRSSVILLQHNSMRVTIGGCDDDDDDSL